MSDGRSRLKRWWHEKVLFVSQTQGSTYLYCHFMRRRIVIQRMHTLSYTPPDTTNTEVEP